MSDALEQLKALDVVMEKILDLMKKMECLMTSTQCQPIETARPLTTPPEEDQ